MPSPFDSLVDIIHSHWDPEKLKEEWKARSKEALAALFGTQYMKRAKESVKLRDPDMKGNFNEVPFAAFIHPENQEESGTYGGMSFVIFPAENAPCLVGMVAGTAGLVPDDVILGRPGHARKMQAISAWLNWKYGSGRQLAWAKQDPTMIDTDVPDEVQKDWSAYKKAFKKYGNVMYALYKPTEDRDGTQDAVTAMLDVMFQERGHDPMAEVKEGSEKIRAAWFGHLMPAVEQNEVVDLLRQRRYVVIEGPPGAGKTRMAGMILKNDYADLGRSIQFHPNTTYENFVGGLAPIPSEADTSSIGFRFAPKRGFLMEAAAAANDIQPKPYLLHIDEINRADLAKILGEAIYLLEADADTEDPRHIDLFYDFKEPFGHRLSLPKNLHILGTMNSADRSIAILDVAVRRRFAFRTLWPRFDVVKERGCPLTQEAFDRLVSIFVEHAPDDSFALVPGHSYFLETDPQRAKVKLKTSLAPLLREYLAQGYVSGFAESIRSYLQWLESKCARQCD
jgi:5-methylcytosine-specific restriction protein B